MNQLLPYKENFNFQKLIKPKNNKSSFKTLEKNYLIQKM